MNNYLKHIYKSSDSYELKQIFVFTAFNFLTLTILAIVAIVAYLHNDLDSRFGIKIGVFSFIVQLILVYSSKYKTSLLICKISVCLAVISGFVWGGSHYSTLTIPIIFFLFFGGRRSTTFIVILFFTLPFVKFYSNHSFNEFGLELIGPLLTIPIIGFLSITLKAHLDTELLVLSKAVDQGYNAIVITDLKGNVEYVNNSFENLSGYALQEVKGENINFLRGDHTSTNTYKELWDTILLGDSWTGEFHNKKKDGTFYWDKSYISPIKINGKIIKFMAIKENITKLKELEEIRQDFEKIMMHDLKTPLNAIIGFPEVLLADENLTESQRESVLMIHNSGNLMLDQIDSTLLLHKIELGTHQIESEEFDLLELISGLIEELDYLSLEKDIKITIEGQLSHSDVQCIIKTEKTLLRIICLNLIKNAIEATGSKGKIEINIYMNRGVVIEIHNDGIIPDKIRDTFFGKYVTSSKINGTGLGTYSAKLMSKSIAADLSFESSIEKGTTLKLILPPEAFVKSQN